MELLDGRSAALVGSDNLHLHDLDGVGASTMASSHITVWRQSEIFIISMHFWFEDDKSRHPNVVNTSSTTW